MNRLQRGGSLFLGGVSISLAALAKAPWFLGVLLGIAGLCFLTVVPGPLSGESFTLGKLVVLTVGIVIAFVSAFLGRRALQFSAPHWLLGLGAAYLLWVMLANLVLSPYRSYTLAGWPGWNSGALLHLGFVVLFLLAATVRDRGPEDRVARLLRRSLFAAAVVVSLTSIAEVLGFNPVVGSRWMTWLGVVRSSSNFPAPLLTVGNSGWLAGLFVLLIATPLLAYRHRLYGLWTLVLAAGLTSTHSKAAILTLIGVHALLLAGWLVRRSVFNRTKLFPFWSAAAMLIGLFGWPLMQSANKTLHELGIAPRLNQDFAVDRSNFSSSQASRFIIYASTISQWRERPFIGWGLDTVHERFYEHLTPSQYQAFLQPLIDPATQTVEYDDGANMVYTKGNPRKFVRVIEFRAIRPHNSLLEELYSHGLIGAALLGLLLVGTAAVIVRHGDLMDWVLLLCVGLYGLYLLLWFTTAAVTPLAAVLLGTAFNRALRRSVSATTGAKDADPRPHAPAPDPA